MASQLRGKIGTLLSYARRVAGQPLGARSVSHLLYFSKWRKSLRKGRSPLEDQAPWVTFVSQKKLGSVIGSDFNVFEFGAGGSSLFFSKLAGTVHTVEHDKEWLDLVVSKMKSLGRTNWTGNFIPPEKSPANGNDYADPELYLSGDPKYSGMSFRNYVTAIDSFPAGHFDVVFVDGRARPSCIKRSIPKVKDGGLLVIDNSERDYYLSRIDLKAQGFREEFRDFGPGPYVDEFWQTTIWKKCS